MSHNYETDIPPLSPIDMALSRLFEIEPTRGALVHYRSNRHLLNAGVLGYWGGIVGGAPNNNVTITNVFTSEEPGLSIHDIVRNQYLEGVSPELARKWRQAVGYDESEDLQTWKISRWLHIAWISALDAYESEPESLSKPGYRGGLFLHPRLPTLPPRPLIEDLYQDRAWLDLVLLTARHELGWFYLKVKTWHEAAARLNDLSDPSLGACLTNDELEHLSMRTHGYYYRRSDKE